MEVDFRLRVNSPGVIVFPKKPAPVVPFTAYHIEDVTNTIVNNIVTDMEGYHRLMSLIVDATSVNIDPGRPLL